MDLIKISNFIKLKRKELGITQDQLAERLFVTEKAISRWKQEYCCSNDTAIIFV